MVDDDIDPTNINEVIWAMASRTDASNSIEILKNLWGTPLDPTTAVQKQKSPDEITSSQALIFSTIPYSSIKDGSFPQVVEASPRLQKKVVKKWKSLFND